MDELKVIKDVLSTSQSGITLAKQIDGLFDAFRPFRPEVKRFRINYSDKSSEIKYLLTLPSGLKRRTHRKIELPVTTGFKIDEVLDLYSTNLLNVDFDSTGNKWVFDANKFPKSEKFLITVKGNVTKDFLDRLVSVKCAKNPTKKDDLDCYWIHSALKDVSVFEKIWDELDIEEVNTDVRIGVERFFGSAIPEKIKKRFEAQRDLLVAVQQGQRNIDKLKYRYRHATMNTNISPSEIMDLVTRLASGEFFSDFVGLDAPFTLGSIRPKGKYAALIPEGVMVDVITDLNYKSPAAKGNLTFERKKYVAKIIETINTFDTSSKKKLEH